MDASEGQGRAFGGIGMQCYGVNGGLDGVNTRYQENLKSGA